MTKNEIVILRANLLGGMDAYVRDVIGDDDITDYWLQLGVPDCATEEDLMWIARDRECFDDVVDAFCECVKRAK